MNLLTTPILYGLAAVAIGAGVLAGVQTLRLANERAEHADTRRENAEVLADLAAKTATAAQAVRTRETEIRGLLDSSNTAREQGIANAVESQQVLVADLRDGNRRLRQQWAGCPASASVSGHAGAQRGADDSADLRATDTGHLARTGDDADIQVVGLQAYTRACQALTQPVTP